MSIKSKTHKGEGFNELRFEDENGKQEVFIHAQKDMNTKVLNDYTTQVHHNSHLQVENEHSETIKGNRYQHQKAEEHHLTESNRKTQILANDYKTVGETEHITIGMVQTTQAGQEIHLKAGHDIVIDGGLSLTLNAGGQHIVLNPAGIWLSSPVKLGGTAMRGTPAGRVNTTMSHSPVSPHIQANQSKASRSSFHLSVVDDIPANNPRVFAKSCTVGEGCRDAAVEKEPSTNFGTMLIYGIASAFSSPTEAHHPSMLPYSGNNQESNPYPINGGTVGSAPVPVIIPTPAGAMISFAPMPIATYPNPNISIPTLLDSPRAACFVSSALLDSANSGKSFTSALMGVMIAELFGDDVQYDETELRDLAAIQGYAKTRVRFFFEQNKNGQPVVRGLHAVEGTRYDEVRVREMVWNSDYQRYEFTQIGQSEPTIFWTPAQPEGSDIPQNTGYPAPDNGEFNQPVIHITPIHEMEKGEQIESIPLIDPKDLNDYILVFPADSGIPPIYVYFSKPYEPNKFFENLAPEDIPHKANIIPVDTLKRMSGKKMIYAVKLDGTLVIAKRNLSQGHIDLVNGEPVLAAGEFRIYGGNIKYIDNVSGHYKPQGIEAQRSAEDAFSKAGFDVTGKYIERAFD